MTSSYCKVEDCNRARETASGYCVMHYKRWKRNGTTECVLRKYSSTDKCEHCGESGPFVKGLCKPCSIRNYRKGYPDRDIAPKGSGTITKAGYHLVTRFGEREYMHRIVTHAKIGQVVHHKDHNPTNNSPDNLEVLSSQSEHMKLHHKLINND